LTVEVNMKRRALGSLEISEVGLGCNNFGMRLDQEATTNVVNAALDAGVTFFDTADTYGATRSEEFLGVALAERRSDVVIATKFGMPLPNHPTVTGGASAAYIRRACEDSLRRLGTDYIDVYQLHYPDAAVPLEETFGALRELVDAGKVREIGCSNFTGPMLRDATTHAGDGPVFHSVQNQYSLLAREVETDGTLAACRELGIGFLPYYPLANGLLTGKVRDGAIPEGTRLAAMPAERRPLWLSEDRLATVNALNDYADAIDTPLLTLAFSWLLSRPEVSSVIAGASSPEQIVANVNAVTTLSPEIVRDVESLVATAL
jgi:aryl-alcohol dehydrogenase-like predicted oxidoreductase